jgi:hypothetical protein
MGSLFGEGDAAKSQRQQQAYANRQSKKIGGDIKKATKESSQLLLSERERLANQGFAGTVGTPGYDIGYSGKNGQMSATINRSGETQGFMDRLLAGLGADEGSFRDLLSQIRPGFGRLSEATQEQLRNQYAKRFGDLRAQLGRRRVEGSSFGNAELARLSLEEEQQARLAKSQALVEELKMTSDVLKAQSDTRNQALTTAFSQIQFEGNMGIQMQNMVMNSMNENTQAQQDLVKMAAGVKMQGALGAGNIQGNLSNTVAGSFPSYNQQQSQEGVGPVLATLGGAALGNTSLFGGGGTANG